MNYDTAIIIGRWQILQHGHLNLLRTALNTAPQVIIVIGSAWRARDAHNPFTWEERKQMFESVLSPVERKRVHFLPIRDYYDDDRWNQAVRAGVARLAPQANNIALVGFKKDHTSAYLDQFLGWKLIEVEPATDISATNLRCIYFEATNMSAALTVISNYVTEGVRGYLEAWAHLPAYQQCAAEHRAVCAYREKYTAPFYLTADAVVTTNGHVLLIKRGGDIGHGLWALPGGFVEPREQFYAAAVRELREETGLNPIASRLKWALRGQAVFDHAGRSPRGRLVTQAFHFELGNSHLPEVRGRSDAKQAKWVPISQLASMENQLFEDHACILDHFLGIFPED
jgi:bifunctional NMN adenylyltransferase/nudix hydrolase